MTLSPALEAAIFALSGDCGPVADNGKCPECGSASDRQKCLWDLGGNCPRHYVRDENRRRDRRRVLVGEIRAAVLADRTALEAENKRLRAELAEARK